MDPITAVAGAVGSIASLFGGKKEQKLANLQFNNNLTQSILTSRYNQEAATQKNASDEKNHKRLLINGIFVFVAVLVFVLVWNLTKTTKK